MMCMLQWQYFGSRSAGEDDLPVGQIDGINVRRVPFGRQPPQAAGHRGPALLRIHLQLVDRVVLVACFAHREDDLLPVEMHFRVADQAFGTGIEQHGSPPRDRIQNLQRAAGPVAAVVRFAGVEDRFRVVMVRQVLFAHHEQDRLRPDQRVGKQRRALQLLERRAAESGAEASCCSMASNRRRNSSPDG